jgi:hypothetical protein
MDTSDGIAVIALVVSVISVGFAWGSQSDGRRR